MVLIRSSGSCTCTLIGVRGEVASAWVFCSAPGFPIPRGETVDSTADCCACSAEGFPIPRGETVASTSDVSSACCAPAGWIAGSARFPTCSAPGFARGLRQETVGSAAACCACSAPGFPRGETVASTAACCGCSEPGLARGPRGETVASTLRQDLRGVREKKLWPLLLPAVPALHQDSRGIREGKLWPPLLPAVAALQLDFSWVRKLCPRLLMSALGLDLGWVATVGKA